LFAGQDDREGLLFYYLSGKLMAVRQGAWKLHFPVKPDAAMQLFHLDHDVEERYDVAAEHPEIVQKMAVLRPDGIPAT
jgi:arylsulfatase A